MQRGRPSRMDPRSDLKQRKVVPSFKNGSGVSKARHAADRREDARRDDKRAVKARSRGVGLGVNFSEIEQGNAGKRELFVDCSDKSRRLAQNGPVAVLGLDQWAIIDRSPASSDSRHEAKNTSRGL